MGCSPWVHEESDKTEPLAHIHAQSRMVSVPCEQIKESTMRAMGEGNHSGPRDQEGVREDVRKASGDEKGSQEWQL